MKFDFQLTIPLEGDYKAHLEAQFDLPFRPNIGDGFLAGELECHVTEFSFSGRRGLTRDCPLALVTVEADWSLPEAGVEEFLSDEWYSLSECGWYGDIVDPGGRFVSIRSLLEASGANQIPINQEN